jgi:hypothetical protein
MSAVGKPRIALSSELWRMVCLVNLGNITGERELKRKKVNLDLKSSLSLIVDTFREVPSACTIRIIALGCANTPSSSLPLAADDAYTSQTTRSILTQ